MRKLILQLAVSLDGFIEGQNGEYDWCFTDQDYGMQAFFERVDTLFMGRKTYEMMSKIENTGLPPFQEYVFSNSLSIVKEGASLVNENLEEQVNTIKSQTGKDIWLFGGAGLTTSLMNLGLVDEIILAIHPIILGAGKPLFQNIKERTHLKLISTKTFDTGLVLMRYEFQNEQ